MFEQMYKLLYFFRLSNHISGRKKLQKIVHLLQHMGASMDMRYAYHNYGPYSSSLQVEVQELVDQGYIEETKSSEGYKYSFLTKGQEFLQKVEDNFGCIEFQLDAEKIELLNKQSSQFLEVLSTYVFLLENGYQQQDAIVKAKELKPHLEQYVEEAKLFYKQHLCDSVS